MLKKITFTPDVNFLHFLLNERGVASINNWMRTYWQSENYLTWNKQVTANHKLTALLGLSWQKNYSEYQGASVSQFY
ncbi:MAG: hypothetical protein WKG06_34165 [Segetibacter sp.]